MPVAHENNPIKGIKVIKVIKVFKVFRGTQGNTELVKGFKKSGASRLFDLMSFKVAPARPYGL